MIEKPKIEELEINKIIPYVNNQKKHPDEQIEKIAASIKEFGYINPIIIDKDNVIIAGHGRYEALKRLGYKKIPVLRADNLTKAQVMAYRIADNKLAELAEWDEELLRVDIERLKQDYDFDIDLLGFDEDELEDILESYLEDDKIENEQVDNIPEIKTKIVIKEGDLIEFGRHKLLCGDSTLESNLKLLLHDEKISLLITDPPYGVRYADKNEFLNQYDKGNRIQKQIENDALPPKELYEFLKSFFKSVKNFLADKNSYYITAPQGGDLLFIFMKALKASGMNLKHMLIWNKNVHVLSRVDYMYKHEPILYGWLGRHEFYGKGAYTKSVWDINKPLKNDLHPTQKPVELYENAILNSTKKGQIVFDGFAGSGSVFIACEKTDRVGRGIELDTVYCQTIIQRWCDYTGIDDIKINGKKVKWSKYAKQKT